MNEYKWYNFLPKNLFIQFKVFANIYYTIFCILQYLPYIKISDKFPPQILPLAVFIGLTALKDLINDMRKSRRDNKVNSQPVIIMNDLYQKKVPWSEIRCGDVVKIQKFEEFPADCIVISCSDI